MRLRPSDYVCAVAVFLCDDFKDDLDILSRASLDRLGLDDPSKKKKACFKRAAKIFCDVTFMVMHPPQWKNTCSNLPGFSEIELNNLLRIRSIRRDYKFIKICFDYVGPLYNEAYRK